MESLKRLVETFETAIGIVQRQATVLMVAVSESDRDQAIISCDRVRAALRQAERIAATLGPEHACHAALLAARRTAAPWIERAPKLSSIRDAQHLFRKFGHRSLPAKGDARDVLSDLDLDGADLSRLDMSRSQFIGVRARDARLVETIARDVRWGWCDFRTGTMTGIRLEGGVLADCTFERATLRARRGMESSLHVRRFRERFSSMRVSMARRSSIAISEAPISRWSIAARRFQRSRCPCAAIFESPIGKRAAWLELASWTASSTACMASRCITIASRSNAPTSHSPTTAWSSEVRTTCVGDS